MLAVLEVRSLMGFWLGHIQGVGRAAFPGDPSEENEFPCLSWFLEGTHIPWLMIPPPPSKLEMVGGFYHAGTL